MNIKKILGIAVGVALVGWILYGNVKQQETQSNEKRTVYAVLPLSGALSIWGKETKDVMDFYLKKNIDNKINLIYIDSESNPSKAITALQSQLVLSKEKNPIVISAISSVTGAILPLIKEYNGFNVSIYTKDSPSYINFTNQQRIAFPILNEIQDVLAYANKHYKTVSILYSEDEMGLLGMEKFKERYVGTIKGTYSFSNSEIEIRNTVLKALDSNPEAFFVVAPASLAYRNILKELAISGYKGGILANQAYQVESVYKNLQGIDNILFPCYDVLIEEPASDKRSKLINELSAFNLKLNCLTIEPYNAIAFVDYLLKNSIPFNRESISNLKTFEGIAGQLKLTKDGDSEVILRLCKTNNGKIVPVEE